MFAGLEVGLGLVILALGMIVPVLVVVWLRRLPHNALPAPASASPFISPDFSHSNEAVLIVQSGGRVEHINNVAPGWVGLGVGESAEPQGLVRPGAPPP